MLNSVVVFLGFCVWFLSNFSGCCLFGWQWRLALSAITEVKTLLSYFFHCCDKLHASQQLCLATGVVKQQRRHEWRPVLSVHGEDRCWRHSTVPSRVCQVCHIDDTVPHLHDTVHTSISTIEHFLIAQNWVNKSPLWYYDRAVSRRCPHIGLWWCDCIVESRLQVILAVCWLHHV